MGSPTGIWTSVSGGMAQMQNMEVISNNMANANTVGFKKDEATFKEYLTSAEKVQDPVIDIPRTVFKDSDFYHFDGRENAMVTVDGVHANHSQGHFQMTNSPLDLAIDGPGYFAIQTPAGLRFSRAGDFKLDGRGQIVTTEGYPLLGRAGEDPNAAAPATPTQTDANGAPIAAAAPIQQNPFELAMRAPASQDMLAPPPTADPNAAPKSADAGAKNTNLKPIVVNPEMLHGPGMGGENHKVRITDDGQIFSGDNLLGTVIIADFPDPKGLRKVGQNLFSNEKPDNIPSPGKNCRIRQGFLEQSNVNSVNEMVNLIKANRLFESNMRAIRTYNDMAGREANEVGKL